MDLFVKCMAKLFESGNLEHEGDVLDGTDLRLITVQEICRIDWSKPIGQSLVVILG
jgi:hypothetical protein